MPKLRIGFMRKILKKYGCVPVEQRAKEGMVA